MLELCVLMCRDLIKSVTFLLHQYLSETLLLLLLLLILLLYKDYIIIYYKELFGQPNVISSSVTVENTMTISLDFVLPFCFVIKVPEVIPTNVFA